MKSVILFCLVVLAGCSSVPAESDTPEGAYLAFYGAALDGDWDRAVDLLCPEVVAELRAVGERIVLLAGMPQEPLAFFLRSIKARVMPVAQIEVVAREPAQVRLRVTPGRCAEGEACQISEVTLRFEDGTGAGGQGATPPRWLVCPQLPALLSTQDLTRQGDGI